MAFKQKINIVYKTYLFLLSVARGITDIYLKKCVPVVLRHCNVSKDEMEISKYRCKCYMLHLHLAYSLHDCCWNRCICLMVVDLATEITLLLLYLEIMY